MTAVTEAPAFTLDDARAAANGILMELADHLEPDTYGCRDCDNTVGDMCDDHGSERRRQQVLEDAAKRVLDARDAVEILTILAAAADPEGSDR